MNKQTRCPLSAAEYAISDRYGVKVNSSNIADFLRQKTRLIQPLRIDDISSISNVNNYLEGNTQSKYLRDIKVVLKLLDSRRSAK